MLGIEQEGTEDLSEYGKFKRIMGIRLSKSVRSHRNTRNSGGTIRLQPRLSVVDRIYNLEDSTR